MDPEIAPVPTPGDVLQRKLQFCIICTVAVMRRRIVNFSETQYLKLQKIARVGQNAQELRRRDRSEVPYYTNS